MAGSLAERARAFAAALEPRDEDVGERLLAPLTGLCALALDAASEPPEQLTELSQLLEASGLGETLVWLTGRLCYPELVHMAYLAEKTLVAVANLGPAFLGPLRAAGAVDLFLRSILSPDVTLRNLGLTGLLPLLDDEAVLAELVNTGGAQCDVLNAIMAEEPTDEQGEAAARVAEAILSRIYGTEEAFEDSVAGSDSASARSSGDSADEKEAVAVDQAAEQAPWRESQGGPGERQDGHTSTRVSSASHSADRRQALGPPSPGKRSARQSLVTGGDEEALLAAAAGDAHAQTVEGRHSDTLQPPGDGVHNGDRRERRDSRVLRFSSAAQPSSTLTEHASAGTATTAADVVRGGPAQPSAKPRTAEERRQYAAAAAATPPTGASPRSTIDGSAPHADSEMLPQSFVRRNSSTSSAAAAAAAARSRRNSRRSSGSLSASARAHSISSSARASASSAKAGSERDGADPSASQTSGKGRAHAQAPSRDQARLLQVHPAEPQQQLRGTWPSDANSAKPAQPAAAAAQGTQPPSIDFRNSAAAPPRHDTRRRKSNALPRRARDDDEHVPKRPHYHRPGQRLPASGRKREHAAATRIQMIVRGMQDRALVLAETPRLRAQRTLVEQMQLLRELTDCSWRMEARNPRDERRAAVQSLFDLLKRVSAEQEEALALAVTQSDVAERLIEIAALEVGEGASHTVRRGRGRQTRARAAGAGAHWDVANGRCAGLCV
jgi:hypothetical protein